MSERLLLWRENRLKAATSALVFYGVAAEIAAHKTEEQGPGSFQIEFLNQLSRVSSSEIDLYGSFEQLKEGGNKMI